MANKLFTKIDSGIRKMVRGIGNGIVKLSTAKIVFTENKNDPKQEKNDKQ